MDGATSFVTVSYQGKTHKIGGYNADSFQEYQDVFQYIREMIKTIEKNGISSGLNNKN